MKTFISVSKGSETTKEDSVILCGGAYVVEVQYVNGELEYILFRELNSTSDFCRRFSNPEDLIAIRDLLNATLIEMKLEEGEYDSI